VLAQNWGGIFVTQEIEITSQALYKGDGEDDDEDGDCLTHKEGGGGGAGRPRALLNWW
jgi:hypothetical protein